MAIDTVERRRSAAGVGFFVVGPGVTPNAAQDAEWRQQAAWGYSGISVVIAPAAVVALGNLGFRLKDHRRDRDKKRRDEIRRDREALRKMLEIEFARAMGELPADEAIADKIAAIVQPFAVLSGEALLVPEVDFAAMIESLDAAEALVALLVAARLALDNENALLALMLGPLGG